MENDYKNTHELKSFVKCHKLSDMYSNINFSALVTIRTEKNKISNEKMRAQIHFGGYDNSGKVILTEQELNPYSYPTTFDAKWDNFKHVDEEYLLIDGFHSINADIGKYSVKIIPLK